MLRETFTHTALNDDDKFDQAIEAIVIARVGGDYWGAQPELPQEPYTLLQVGEREARRSIQCRQGENALVCWIDQACTKQPRNDHTTYVTGVCDPWHLISGATSVITDCDDDLVLIAAMAGLPVLSADGEPVFTEKGGRRKLRDKIRARIGQCSYRNPFTGGDMSLSEAVALCVHWRQLIDSNRPIRAAIGFASWKKSTAAPLLWAGSDDNPFAAKLQQIAEGDQIAAWKSRVTPAMLSGLEEEGAKLIEVEDGFIRSIGLGANCVPPLSLVVDRQGIYFDPKRPSDLELMLQEDEFSHELLDRACSLRSLVVTAGVSKYGVGHRPVERRAPGRRHILVPGQVEDDRSVLCGGGAIRTNLDLLEAVRRDMPDAYILYKPHPDVQAGHRVGNVAEHDVARFADEYVRDQAITSFIEMVDEVHVNTSLAGFEALLRGKSVITHGVPFYAGWGLTRDLGMVPGRRTRRRTLDELVAAVLLIYPRYLDPVTGLPCTAEILVRRLTEGTGAQRSTSLVSLRRLQGYMKRRLTSLLAAWQ